MNQKIIEALASAGAEPRFAMDLIQTLINNSNEDRLIDDTEAARILGKDVQTLRNARSQGNPNYPPFYKLGRSVRYKLSEVWAHIERQKCTNTLQGS